jgi:hypothetical protein
VRKCDDLLLDCAVDGMRQGMGRAAISLREVHKAV